MKKEVRLLLIVAVLLFLPVMFFAQSHDLVVPDFTASGLYLDDQIMSDSTAFGTRKDPDRVYVLQMNGTYLVKSNIRNTNWVLRIKAGTGTGTKPIVYSFRNPATNAYPSQVLLPQGDLYVSNVIFCGYSEIIPGEMSAMPAIIINFNSAGFNGYFDGCVFSETRAVDVQIGAGTKTMKFTDCVFANSGNILNTNPGNGRAIDCRGTSVDSLIVQNCSMVNFIDRAVRHYSSTAPINNFYFDHNTVANCLSYHGNIALGWVGKSQVINNNVFVDNFVLGNDSTDDVRLVEFVDSKERDQYGNIRMCFVSSFPNDTTKWYVANNFYGVTAPVQAFYDQHSNIGLGKLIPLTWHINKKIALAGLDSTKAFTKETITFTKCPTAPVAFTTWYWDPTKANKAKVQTGWDPKYDMERHTSQYYSDTLNLAYQTTAAAYTGAMGFPAGNLNYFPTQKAAWAAYKLAHGGLTDVEAPSLPKTFTLEQNYPNPFNPTTVIAYSVPQASNVKLEVYDILGRLVTTLVNEVKQVGNYKVDFNASKLSTGVYVYRLSSQNQVISKKMMLIK